MPDSAFDRRYASSLIDEIDFRDKVVLDAGFGDGWLIDARWQEVKSITAVENNMDLVVKAKERWADTPVAEKVSFFQGDMGELLLPEDHYDLVIFSHSY